MMQHFACGSAKACVRRLPSIHAFDRHLIKMHTASRQANQHLHQYCAMRKNRQKPVDAILIMYVHCPSTAIQKAAQRDAGADPGFQRG
jgi:hypothetical protein